MAGSPGRVKRADEVKLGFSDLLKSSRELVDLSVTIVTAVAEAMPKTEEYATHRNDIDAYLNLINDLKKKSGNCALKAKKSLDAMESLFQKYDDDNSEKSEEYKAVAGLYEKFGKEEFDKAAKEFVEKYDNDSFLDKHEIDIEDVLINC